MSETESKPRGVYRTSYGNRFYAQVMVNGKRYYLGTYATAAEAGEVAQAARDQLSNPE